MPFLDAMLSAGAVGATVTWVALSAYVVLVQRRRTGVRATASTAVAVLASDEIARLPPAERLARLQPLVAHASRESVMHAAAADATPPDAAGVLADYLVERWGLEALERDAESHRAGRDKWRRMAALRILTRMHHARALTLVGRALEGRDADVASVALSLLGESTDPAAGDLLIQALEVRRHPRSVVAMQIDRSPLNLADRLRPLLADPDPLIRRWAATLLGRYDDVDNLERVLAAVADDPDPRVRKAAVQSLGQMGSTVAAVTALHLLNDPIPYVRAAAARAIGRLDRDDLAQDVALLLGDRDWWVRFAAKECLQGMGPDIWPVLVRLLDDHDRYVRNGAAEVFQNLGVLDSFIVMEAATDNPAARKIDLLTRIASAGGLRLTDSLLERAGSSLGPRVRQLLNNIGLEHVGAA